MKDKFVRIHITERDERSSHAQVTINNIDHKYLVIEEFIIYKIDKELDTKRMLDFIIDKLDDMK